MLTLRELAELGMVVAFPPELDARRVMSNEAAGTPLLQVQCLALIDEAALS